MNIYVGNLPYSVSESELKEIFGEFGEVAEVKIITDRFSGQSKGFGFVEMPDSGQAQDAIKSINGKDIKGRNVKVNEARPRNDRPSGGHRDY